MFAQYYFFPSSTHPVFYQATVSSFVPSSVYQHSTSPHQGTSANNEGHNLNTHRGQEDEEVLVHCTSQPNAKDSSNTGAVADAQADVLRCMLSTAVSPFGDHIFPCREGFADLDSLMIHLRDRHGVRGPDCMRLNCVWLTNGVRLCGENIRKSGYKRHIAVHLGLRVVCEECSLSFSRRDTLSKHTKEKHKAE